MDMPEERLRSILNRRFDDLRNKRLISALWGLLTKADPVVLQGKGIDDIKKPRIGVV